MNNAPLISVIIPFLNPGKWLSEAIDSVINQTYTNWEIILVDDGSVAADSNLAKTYAKEFQSKIIYTEHCDHINKGLTASRNSGVANSTGELIAFLDADDCWLPEKLYKQLEIFNRFPQVQMVCEASVFWYSWKNADYENHTQFVGAPQGIYQRFELPQKLYPLSEGPPPCPSGIIITREAIERAGRFEEQFSGVYQLYEDQAFLMKVYLAEVVYVSCEANNMYRKRSNSMSSAASDKNIYKKVRLFYLNWLEEYLCKKCITDITIKKLVTNFKNRLETT